MQFKASFSIISTELKDIFEGIRLFNRGDFFSAHDVFEKLWLESDKTEKQLLQGLVQLSVGCFHLISGNYKGAFSQLSKGKDKLKNYLPSCKNINLEFLISDLDLLIVDLEDFNSNKKIKVDLNKIPRIKTLF